MAQLLNTLIVEDSEDDTLLLLRHLRAGGYEPVYERVETSCGMREALARRSWDIILCDHNLPGFDAFGAVKLLKEMGVDAPLIIVSASMGEEAAVAAMKGGASDYFLKSHLARLIPAIERELRDAETRRRHRKLRDELRRIVAGARCLLWTATVEQADDCLRRNAHPMDEEAAQRFFPLDVPEGQSYTDVWHRLRSGNEPLSPEIRDAIREGKTECRREFCCADRDGRLRWLSEEIHVEPLQANRWGVVGVCTDITERKQAEEDLRQANRLLEQTLNELQETQKQILRQERLLALGEMASGIAHDLNNTLVPILGFSELLTEQGDRFAAEDRHALQMVHTAALAASDVVARLREFYRDKDDALLDQPVDLNRVVSDAVAMTQPKWRDEAQSRGVRIDVETLIVGNPVICGDENEIRQSLVNLILNAVDAMPKGGALTVTGQNAHFGHDSLPGPAIVVTVSDTGIGMSPDVQKRCFDPFFTTKGRVGTGLGLATVYGVVRRHGGTVSVESREGMGTTFSLWFPARVSPANLTEACPKRELSLRRLRILVVDDEPPVREWVETVLREDGHAVETAPDGVEALARLDASAFDVVITDRAMPNMGGDELSRVIAERFPQIRVLMLTGFGTMMTTLPAGVQMLMSKPITHIALRNALASVVGS